MLKSKALCFCEPPRTPGHAPFRADHALVLVVIVRDKPSISYCYLRHYKSAQTVVRTAKPFQNDLLPPVQAAFSTAFPQKVSKALLSRDFSCTNQASRAAAPPWYACVPQA